MGASCHFLGKIAFVLSLAEGLHGGVEIIVRLAVGGGAGRSDGFMDFCSNYGMIYGRKDVGGIVGQMEPYLHLSLRDDLIARLRAELDKLNALVSSTLDDVDSTNDHISSRLD